MDIGNVEIYESRPRKFKIKKQTTIFLPFLSYIYNEETAIFFYNNSAVVHIS